MLERENNDLKTRVVHLQRKSESIAAKSKAAMDKKLTRMVEEFESLSKERKSMEKEKEENQRRIDAAQQDQIRDLFREVGTLRNLAMK
jgi:hypothetical protein